MIYKKLPNILGQQFYKSKK